MAAHHGRNGTDGRNNCPGTPLKHRRTVVPGSSHRLGSSRVDQRHKGNQRHLGLRDVHEAQTKVHSAHREPVAQDRRDQNPPQGAQETASMSSNQHAHRLRATRFSEIGGTQVLVSRRAKEAAPGSEGTERIRQAAVEHIQDPGYRLTIHHHPDWSATLVARTLGNEAHVFIMTEDESIAHYGHHADEGNLTNKSKHNMSIGSGIAKAASEMGCALAFISVMALIAYGIYMKST